MPDPLSWKVIERGWKVRGIDGTDLGRVDDIVGDTSADIFSGISLSEGLLKKRRFVPSDRVREIYEGEVHVDVSAAAVEQLDEYDEPPPQEEILAPDPKR